MPYATSKGVRIHYSDKGAETSSPTKTVVLVQGLGLSSRFWFDVPDRIAKLGRRVVTIDNRGTGKSDRPKQRVWSVRTMADDVAAVLDHAGVDRAVIVGISMGGMIAQEVALRHPTRAEGLVLMATTPGFLAATLPAPSAVGRLLSIPFGGKRASRNLTRLLLPESKWHRGREIFAEWPNALRDDPTAISTFVAHLFAASTHYVARRLGDIRCPVVVVAGAEDSLVPLGNAKVLARRIPGAVLEVVADAGHALFAEDRDLVGRMVTRLAPA
jgi:3-oxoadipate enol-lactonase